LSERVPSLFVVSGPSGAGKSTLLTRVLEQMPDVRFSVSHTTRAPRRGERDGVQYHFVDRHAFEDLVRRDGFLEWAEVHTQLYGTSRGEYEVAQREGRDLLLDVDVQGAQQVRARLQDAVSIFILPPSHAALERRLRGRGPEDEVALQRRLAAADREMSHYREYDYAIINESLEQSVEVLRCVILAARSRTSRLEGPAQEILNTFSRQGET
jgi:guanylate kinase